MAIAFVDETGDPGTGGKGTPWFCWVAIVAIGTGALNLMDAPQRLPKADSKAWGKSKFSGDDLAGALQLVMRRSG